MGVGAKFSLVVLVGVEGVVERLGVMGAGVVRLLERTGVVRLLVRASVVVLSVGGDQCLLDLVHEFCHFVRVLSVNKVVLRSSEVRL